MKTYEIEKRIGLISGLNYYDVIISGGYITTYLDESEAYQKIANSLNKYCNFQKENEVKNVMFKSSNNSHNSII